MDHFVPLAFLAAGLILIVLEMASLTFYLGALGVAALVTAVVAWFYPLENWQAAFVFAVACAIMLPLAHLLRRRMQAGRDHVLVDTDKGSRVTIAETGGRGLRVRYRDSLWEAEWEGVGSPQVGQSAEIVAREGARLRIRPVQ